MQENEFEKQVQEIMNDFRLKPSESVWTKVEERIPKSNTGTRRFLAFLLLLIGFAVSGYFFYSKWNNNPALLNNAIVKKQSSANVKYNEDSAKGNAENKISRHQINSIQSRDANRGNSDQFENIVRTDVVEKKNEQFAREQSLVLNTNNVSQNNKKDKPASSLLLFEVDTSRRTYYDKISVEKEQTDPSFSTSSNKEKLSIIRIDNLKRQLLNNINVAAQTKQEPQKLNRNKNWQFGLAMLYGKADVTEKFLDEDKSLPQTNGTGGYSRGDTSYSNAAKNVKGKTSFSLGISLKKAISRNSTLIAGVEYMELNTQIETGSLKDSTANFSYDNTGLVTSVSSFYRAGTNNTHINRYHMLQIPLIYEYRLTEGRDVAIGIDAGLSLTQLISSNALVYDPYHQAYYHNDDLFQKTQVAFIAGSNFQFALSNKTAVNIGPQIQYNFSNLLRNNTYASQHFFIWGLKAMVLLKK